MEGDPVSLGPSSCKLHIASPLGVGLWSWGDRWTWGYNSFDKSLTHDSMRSAFEASLAADVNFFDTAEVALPSVLCGSVSLLFSACLH